MGENNLQDSEPDISSSMLFMYEIFQQKFNFFWVFLVKVTQSQSIYRYKNSSIQILEVWGSFKKHNCDDIALELHQENMHTIF